MKHISSVSGKHNQDFEENIEKQLQELQSKGYEIINVSVGGRSNDSGHAWLALILYEDKE